MRVEIALRSIVPILLTLVKSREKFKHKNETEPTHVHPVRIRRLHSGKE